MKRCSYSYQPSLQKKMISQDFKNRIIIRSRNWTKKFQRRKFTIGKSQLWRSFLNMVGLKKRYSKHWASIEWTANKINIEFIYFHVYIFKNAIFLIILFIYIYIYNFNNKLKGTLSSKDKLNRVPFWRTKSDLIKTDSSLLVFNFVSNEIFDQKVTQLTEVNQGIRMKNCLVQSSPLFTNSAGTLQTRLEHDDVSRVPLLWRNCSTTLNLEGFLSKI